MKKILGLLILGCIPGIIYASLNYNPIYIKIDTTKLNDLKDAQFKLVFTNKYLNFNAQGPAINTTNYQYSLKPELDALNREIRKLGPDNEHPYYYYPSNLTVSVSCLNGPRTSKNYNDEQVKNAGEIYFDLPHC